MDCITPENEELFIFSEENDIGSFMGSFDDVLKDPLLSWPVTDEADDKDLLLGLPNDKETTSHYQETFSDVSTLIQKPENDTYQNPQDPGNMQSVNYPQMEFIKSDKGTKECLEQSYVTPVKIEPRKIAPELVKLLSNQDQSGKILYYSDNVLVSSDSLKSDQCNLLLPGQSRQSTNIPTPVSMSLQSLPVHSLALQAQNFVFSPQQAPLLPKHVHDSGNTMVTLASYQPSVSNPQLTSAQLVTSTPQQVPVQQLVLRTELANSTVTPQRPIQLVIDPSALPVVNSTPPTDVPPPPRVEKHRAHNAIERKYRTSINDKIAELRELLFGGDAKIQKSGVLKKAIDHIKQLRSANARLRQQNISSKIKMQQLGILSCATSEVPSYPNSVDILPAPLTPESISDIHSSCASTSDSPPSSPCKSDDSFPESVVMSDTTRIGLCMVMLSFFVFDPFNLVLSWQKGWFSEPANLHSASEVHSNGRLLMSTGGLENTQSSSSSWWMLFSLISMLVRSVVVGFLFLKLFVFGEPTVQPDSNSAAKYWSFKTQADGHVEKGEYIAGSKMLRRCLESVSRPFPTSRLDVAFSLVWQIFRQIVYRLWIVQWLTNKIIQYFTFRSTAKKEKSLRQESAKQASLVYHKLHQLYLTGHVPGNPWLATVIALNAVNLAEIADGCMSEEQLVEIYVDAAIQLRSTLPTNLQFLARYFLRRARRLCRGQSLTLPYSCWWLFTPIGHRFFVSGEWSCKKVHDIWNSSKNNENKPLMNVAQSFCRFLLEQALSTLLLPPKQDVHESKESEDNSGRIQALDMLHTLSECVNNCRTSLINRNVKVFGEITSWPSHEANVVGCWWGAVAKVAACWLTEDVEGGEKQRKILENIPEEIKNNDDPIGRALLMAFEARVDLLGNSDKTNEERRECCDKAGALLTESIAFASLYPENKLLKLMQLLCCDWLLSTRVELWEKEKHDEQTKLARSRDIDGYDKDLKSLQNICFNMPEAQPKVYLYQATQRIMAGASPLRTRQLLQKINQGNGTKTPLNLFAEKDKATALIMASSHLPASLFTSKTERKGMVIEAMDSLQRLGAKNRMTRCRKLLMSI